VAVGSTARRGIDVLGSILRIAGMVIVSVLVVHILLSLLGANPENWLTQWIWDAADTFNLGLSNLFPTQDPRWGVVLNYGIAALIWLLITAVVVRLLRRIS
jgi:hypothetical protein